MGINARERHGLFRCGAFAAARVRCPSILKGAGPMATSRLLIGSRGLRLSFNTE